MVKAWAQSAPTWIALKAVLTRLEALPDESPEGARLLVIRGCAGENIRWCAREPADLPAAFWQGEPSNFTFSHSDVTNRATRVIMSDGFPDVVAVTLRGVQLAWEDVAALRPEIGVEVVREAVSVMEPKSPIPQNPPAGTPRPGSTDAWIDELCPNGAWRNSTAKRIHDLTEQEIAKRNAEIEREAKKLNRKPPPAMRCPGLRAFQTALAKRRRKPSEAERNKAQ
jgi:hypothetical protein